MTEREIFAKALLCPNRDLRDAFLDEACGPAGPLRERLEQLLTLHESPHDLFDKRPADLLAALAEPSEGRAPDTDWDSTARQLAPFMVPSPRPEALGRIGHYDVLKVLGQGGFGIVVKAFDDSLHRIVAVKVLAPHLAVTSPPRKRFLREARAAARVKHDHVVQIYAVEEQPLPYLVMEYVEGQTLQQQLDATGPLEAAEVVRLGQQIARGLAAAHAMGLIHRDVKPANILLEAGIESRVKLTDFGLARTSDDASLTQSGVLAGSPLYMAPEQARGEALDQRADLFSLGSVLYAMLTGRPPFRAADTLAILKRVAEEPPRPIRQVIPEAPEGLCAVVGRLHHKDPAGRFGSATEVAEALSRCLTDPPRRPSPVLRRRHALAGVAVVLLLAAGGVWLGNPFAGSGGPEGRPPDAASTDEPGERPSGEPAAARPSGLSVTSLLDDESEGTLRWAVRQANLRRGEDVITFDPAVFAAPRTITLTRGPLVLIDSAQTTITGPAAGLTVSGDDKSQVLVIGASDEKSDSPARAWITGLTIAHGRTTEELQIGGGVYCRGGATLTLIGCTLRDNQALHENGGGGAVFNGGSTLLLTNCTLARNQGVEGGGIKNYIGQTTVINCTFVGNSAARGGGVFTNGYSRARTEAFNSLFNNNSGGDLVLGDGLEVTGDYNLTGDGSAPGPHSLLNTDARLGPLGRNGGPTETATLLTGSPALNAGDNSRVPPTARTDQRGLPRVVGGTVDLGAFEAQ